MTERRHESLSRYRLGLRCTCPRGRRDLLCPLHGDARDTNIDRRRYGEQESSILGSIFIGCIGALIGGVLLGWW